MPLSIGVNLRVTGHCNQGGRKYMEDMFSVAFQPTPDDKDLEYAFFGIFDGHGGGEAATFAKEHLMDIIVKQKNFWSDRDEDVLRAIRDGYVNTHYAMWRELDKWPRTASGLPSTAGTTASIAFIRKGKIYIGHVGDSGIILGYQVDGDPQWRAQPLTKDHKPESGPEMIRIQRSGGKVVSKSGVPRVVWNRPRIGHKGPVRRSTHIDEIPFLAVARSLGDLWSYNSELNTFVVSPEPDVKVVAIDVKAHRCLIFGTDGLWNMLTPHAAVAIVQAADRHNEKQLIASQQTCNGQMEGQMWINPSKSLVDRALERWSSTRLRADNTSVVTLMLDPPGPSRSEVLLSQKERVVMHHSVVPPTPLLVQPPPPPLPMQPPPPPLPPPAPPATFPQPLEQETTQPLTQDVQRPEMATNHTVVDVKQPDSSDGVGEASSAIGSTTLTEKPVETVAAASIGEPKNKTMCSIDSETTARESIQVAEISSTELSDEGVDRGAVKEPENVAELDNAKESKIVLTRSIYDCEGVRVRVRKVTKMRCTPEHGATDKDTDGSTQEESSRRSGGSTKASVAPSVSGSDRDPTAVFDSDIVRTMVPELIPELTNGRCEVKNSLLTSCRQKQPSVFPSPRNEKRTMKRKLGLNSHSQNNLAETASTASTFVTRFKSRTTRITLMGATEEGSKSSINKTVNSTNVGTKRKHSAISGQTTINSVEETCAVQESCAKKRTHSEDRANPTDENDPSNQAIDDPTVRLGWPSPETIIGRATGTPTVPSNQERLSPPNTFSRRNLAKMATPVKAIRRPSLNGSNRIQQLRSSFGLREWDHGRNNRSSNCSDRRIAKSVTMIGTSDNATTPQRWLRSDTIAATPVKTLRSRNVDITGHTVSPQLVHQYGVAKPNRLSLPTKIKQSTSNSSTSSSSSSTSTTTTSTTNTSLQSVGSRVRSSSIPAGKLKQVHVSGNGSNVGPCPSVSSTSTNCSSNSGMAKRVKSSYNPSARSLSTRSRIKRLGK